MSGIFGYKINIVEGNIATSGFPSSIIMKMRSKLEELKINYMMIDQRNNYDVDVTEDFKNLNTYDEQFEKAYKIVKNRKIISHIVEELEMEINKPNFKEITRRIEDIIDESRKI